MRTELVSFFAKFKITIHLYSKSYKDWGNANCHKTFIFLQRCKYKLQRKIWQFCINHGNFHDTVFLEGPKAAARLEENNNSVSSVGCQLSKRLIHLADMYSGKLKYDYITAVVFNNQVIVSHKMCSSLSKHNSFSRPSTKFWNYN